MAVRIVIADDLSFMRMVQREILQEKGYDVVAEASDGFEAVDKYKQFSPDVIILDITMPHMNGLEAMYKIFEYDRKAKIIICSALGQQQLIVEAIKAGVKDFIVKPFKPERVITAIEKAIK